MIYIGIDPGPKTSGVVAIRECGVTECEAANDNQDLLNWLADLNHDVEWSYDSIVLIEWIESYGMPVGAETFHTCRWVGRFQQAALDAGMAVELVPRKTVKMTLCGSMRAKDSNVRQALIDRYGGSRGVAVGTKKKPGPLYGVSGHAWSALAVVEAWKMDNKVAREV